MNDRNTETKAWLWMPAAVSAWCFVALLALIANTHAAGLAIDPGSITFPGETVPQ